MINYLRKNKNKNKNKIVLPPLLSIVVNCKDVIFFTYFLCFKASLHRFYILSRWVYKTIFSTIFLWIFYSVLNSFLMQLKQNNHVSLNSLIYTALSHIKEVSGTNSSTKAWYDEILWQRIGENRTANILYESLLSKQMFCLIRG